MQIASCDEIIARMLSVVACVTHGSSSIKHLFGFQLEWADGIIGERWKIAINWFKINLSLISSALFFISSLDYFPFIATDGFENSPNANKSDFSSYISLSFASFNAFFNQHSRFIVNEHIQNHLLMENVQLNHKIPANWCDLVQKVAFIVGFIYFFHMRARKTKRKYRQKKMWSGRDQKVVNQNRKPKFSYPF